MLNAVAEWFSGARRARLALGLALLMRGRLAVLLAAALLAGTSGTAQAAELRGGLRAAGQPSGIYAYVLLGGLAGTDGYLDSNGMLLLAGRIASMPNVWVETYPWSNWVEAANRLWAGPSKDDKVVVVGFSGGGSRATWLANSVLNKPIDLMVTYDPSPSWQMQNLPPNVKKAITYQNQAKFFFGLGGGELTGSNAERHLVTEEHLAVQFDERLHQITLQAIQDLAKGERSQGATLEAGVGTGRNLGVGNSAAWPKMAASSKVDRK